MSFNPSSAIIGEIRTYAALTAPAGWLLSYGQAISRTTYAALFSILNPTVGTSTITIATPGVVTHTAHGLVAGDPIFFGTTGALPTGITAGTKYFVIAGGLTANAFEFSATLGGSAVNTSGSQSGVHTLYRSPFGIGDGSTTFNTPDCRGRVAAFSDVMGGTAANRLSLDTTQGINGKVFGATGGEQSHVILVSETPVLNLVSGTDTAPTTSFANGEFSDDAPNAHNNVQPAIILNAIIFTGV